MRIPNECEEIVPNNEWYSVQGLANLAEDFNKTIRIRCYWKWHFIEKIIEE